MAPPHKRKFSSISEIPASANSAAIAKISDLHKIEQESELNVLFPPPNFDKTPSGKVTNMDSASSSVMKDINVIEEIPDVEQEADFLKDLKEMIFGKGSSNNHLLSLLRDDVSREKINLAFSEIIKIQDKLSPTTVHFINRTKSILDTMNLLLRKRNLQHLDLDTLGKMYENLLEEREKLEKCHESLVESAKSLADSAEPVQDKMEALEHQISELKSSFDGQKNQLRLIQKAYAESEERRSTVVSKAKSVAQKVVSAAQDIQSKKAELEVSDQQLHAAFASLDELRRNVPF